MPINTTQYGLQKVFHIRGYDYLTGDLLLDLKKLKESVFTNGQETVYLTGGRANAQQASFDHSKTAMISGSNATIDEGLVQAQLGKLIDTLTDTTEIEYEEILTVKDDEAITKYVAQGDAGEEIKVLRVISTNEDLVQDATVSAGKFTYTPATKLLTFNTAELADGTKIKVIYYPKAASAKKITNSTQEFSKTLRLVADVLLKDACTDQLVRGQIVAEKGKISGEFEWNVSADGEPAVHNFEATFLEGCENDNLWDMYIFDESDFDTGE